MQTVQHIVYYLPVLRYGFECWSVFIWKFYLLNLKFTCLRLDAGWWCWWALKATNANIFYADSKYCCRYYVWLPWPFRIGHRERKADTEKLPERKCPEVTSAEPEEEEILDPINEELERATKLLEKVHKVRRGVRDNVSTSLTALITDVLLCDFVICLQYYLGVHSESCEDKIEFYT